MKGIPVRGVSRRARPEEISTEAEVLFWMWLLTLSLVFPPPFLPHTPFFSRANPNPALDLRFMETDQPHLQS